MHQPAKQAVSASRPLPLVVGVTGHRDLREQDRGQLVATVRQILLQLKADYPHTSLVLLSALAEGADRLVAQVALDLGILLIVPLPRPVQEYKQEFTSDEARAEFDRLLHRAGRSFDLPSIDARAGSAGAYIARNCQILLALWDGGAAENASGTAEVVRLKLGGADSPLDAPRNPLDPVDSGPVCQVVTPRASVPVAEPFTVRLLLPEQHSRQVPVPYHLLSKHKAEKVHRRIVRRMDRFNRDVGRHWDGLAGQRQQSMDHVFAPDAAKHLPASVHAALTYYGVANALALHFQRWSLRSVRAIVLLVMAAAICYHVYSALKPQPPLWLLIGYLATFLCAYVVYGCHWGLDSHNKYLDYRALAEGLRVRMFWRLAGVKTQVADRYLSKQHSEMDWIRQAIRVWTIPAHADTGDLEFHRPDPARLQLVLDRWVKYQRDYFQKTARSNDRRALVCVVISSGFFLLAGFGLAIVKVFIPTEDPLLVVLTLTLVASALLQVYSRVLGYSEQARQYDRMQKIFARGAALVEKHLKAGELKQAQEIIRDLGEEALIENGEWLLLHRSQPVEVPGA
jgi:hypothetical protein